MHRTNAKSIGLFNKENRRSIYTNYIVIFDKQQRQQQQYRVAKTFVHCYCRMLDANAHVWLETMWEQLQNQLIESKRWTAWTQNGQTDSRECEWENTAIAHTL